MTSTETPRALWERLFPLLDPQMPAGTPASGVRRIDRPYSPLDTLVHELRRPLGLRKELLYGPPGSGKTTELLALLPQLHDLRTPLFLDLLRHFQEQRGDARAIDHLQPWEVLAVIGLGVYRLGEELGLRWTQDETHALQTALAEPGQTQTTLDVGALVKEVALLLVDSAAPGAGLALKTIAAVAGSASASLPLGLPGRSAWPDQDSRVQRLKHAVTRLIVRVNDVNPKRRLLLVVDGLDRGDGAMAQRLFVDSGLIADLPCDLVVCVPPDLPVRNVRGFTIRPLTTLPVMDRKNAPAPNPQGLTFFWDLWCDRLRTAEIEEELASKELVSHLAWASGGLVREFLQMARGALGPAWDDNTAMTRVHVDAVVDQWRRTWEEGLGTSKVERLRAVQQQKRYDDIPIDLELLRHKCILAYPNESIWYYPHPLLTIKLL